jgi:hypothetical protein
MFGPSPFFPGTGGATFASGGPSGFSGRDIIWVDLRFPSGIGNNGTEDLPFSTANLGLGTVPDGGTLIMVGGDATTEPGVSIGARSFTAHGLGGFAPGGLTPKLPTLTYAITTGTQSLEFHNISVALVHSGAAASLTQFRFEFCPVITLTGGTDAPPVYWVGDGTCLFSGAGGPAEFHGGTIDGYTANSGAVLLDGCNVTGNIESPTEVTILGGCSFTAISITAPSIKIDLASHKLAEDAGVTFSSAVTLLVETAAPVDIGTANAAGSAKSLALSDHVHDLPFTPVQDALGAATSSISINSQRITNSAAPVDGGDLTNRTYVDALVAAAASGLKVKTEALVVAIANQATMTGQAQTIDGVALNTVGMRVLLIAQTTATQNGLWLVQAGAWIRPVDGTIAANDFSTGSSAAQSYVLVTSGTLRAGYSYFCTNTVGSDVVGTDNLNWTLFGQPLVIIDGAGLVKTGSTFDVVAGDATIVVNANELHVGVIGNANLANNTIALARLANAGAQYDFMMRVSASGGAWEDGTVAQARTALGIIAYGALYPVRAATTGNITLSGTQTVDTVALIAGDRCLVKNQTTGSQNGPYVVASGAWTRATDADGSGELVGGMLFPISEGGQGKRVAMLTTNDPIVIGTTALTFAMDRVAALGAVAPLDVTKSAAAIGTSTLAAPLDHKHDISTAVVLDISTGANAEGTATSLARSDHVHRLTFAVVAAALAAASAAISVNSQKITNLATPTVSTDAATKAYVDAHTGIPGGSTTQLQYNNAGVFDGASGITVVGSETALSFGTTTNVSAGDTRHAHGATISAGRLQSGSGGVPILRWGVGTNNYILIGGGVEGVAGLQLEVTTGSIELKIATAQEYLFSDTALTMNGNNLVMGTGFVTFGSGVATAGFNRFGQGPGTLLGYVAHEGTTKAALAVNGDGNTFSDVVLGDSHATHGNASLYLQAKTQVLVHIAGATEYSFSATALTMQNNNLVMGTGFASFGATVASQGSVRAANGFTMWTVNASAADRRVIETAGEDQSFGSLAGTGTRYWDAGDGGVHNFRDGNAGSRTLASLSHAGGLNMLSRPVVGASYYATSGAVASTGENRFTHNSGAFGRNNANSANVPIWRWGALTDTIVIGGGTEGVAGLQLEVTTGTIQAKIATTVEYEFSSTTADFKNNVLSFGTTPAGSGTIRHAFVASATTLQAFRNGANSADVNVIGFGSVGVNDVDVGSHNSTNGSALNLYAANGIYLRPDNAGDPYVFDTGLADFGSNDLRFLVNGVIDFFDIAGTSSIGSIYNIGDDLEFKAVTELSFKIGSTQRLAIAATSVLVNAIPLILNNSSLQGADFVECLQSGVPASPGSAGAWRVYSNASGALVAKNNAGTIRTLASP